MNPVVLAVGGLEDELIKVGISFRPIEPLAGGFKVDMTFVIVPGRITGQWQTAVGSFAQGVLGGVTTSICTLGYTKQRLEQFSSCDRQGQDPTVGTTLGEKAPCYA